MGKTVTPRTRTSNRNKKDMEEIDKLLSLRGRKISPNLGTKSPVEPTQGFGRFASSSEGLEGMRRHHEQSANPDDIADQGSSRSTSQSSQGSFTGSNSAIDTQNRNHLVESSQLQQAQDQDLWENLPSLVAEIESRSTFLDETPIEEARRFLRLPQLLRTYVEQMTTRVPEGLEMETVTTDSGEEMVVIQYTGAVQFREVTWNAPEIPNQNSRYSGDLDPFSRPDHEEPQGLPLPISEAEQIDEKANNFERMPTHSKSVTGVLAKRALIRRGRQRRGLIPHIKKIFTKLSGNWEDINQRMGSAELRERSSFQRLIHSISYFRYSDIKTRVERSKGRGGSPKQSPFHRLIHRIGHVGDSGIDVSAENGEDEMGRSEKFKGLDGFS